jgi:hypothetical protein
MQDYIVRVEQGGMEYSKQVRAPLTEEKMEQIRVEAVKELEKYNEQTEG